MKNIKDMTGFQMAGDGLRSSHEGGLNLEARILLSCLFLRSLCHLSSSFLKEVGASLLFHCPISHVLWIVTSSLSK